MIAIAKPETGFYRFLYGLVAVVWLGLFAAVAAGAVTPWALAAPALSGWLHWVGRAIGSDAYVEAQNGPDQPSG